MPPASAFSFGVVILAAGASTRMGKPKMLLPWDNTTILGHLIQFWQRSGALQIGVLCPARARYIEDELDRLAFPTPDRIINPNPQRGMFSSVQSASLWTGWQPNITHLLITLGDQPHLKQSTIESLLQFARERATKICQPRWQGRPKHPVVFPKSFFARLATTSAATLKAFLELNIAAREFIDVNDPGLDLDLDRPEDYEKAKQLRSGVGWAETLLTPSEQSPRR